VGDRDRHRRTIAAWIVWVVLGASAGPVASQQLLVPMDREQENHLKAYGFTFGVLTAGQTAEWLLNYRAGSFLVPDTPDNRRRAAIMGVSVEGLDGAGLAGIRREIEGSNMEAVPLEKAPKIAIYTPPNSSPWDDAVTMALEYA